MPGSSSTINRHVPIIPPELYFGVTPIDEMLGERVIRNLLAGSGITEITRWQHKYNKKSTQRNIITPEMLRRGEDAITEVTKQRSIINSYLMERGVTAEMADFLQICPTQALVSALDADTARGLSLRLPDDYAEYIDPTITSGVSIPYYFDDKFCGFATRVLGNKAEYAKYAFSCPNRLCFGFQKATKEIFVVEGIFDATAMMQAGYFVLGLGDSQPNFFKMKVVSDIPRINLLFDNDYGGYLGAIKSYIILSRLLDVAKNRISILIPLGKDPAEQCGWTQISFGKLVTKVQEFRHETERH